MAAHLGGQGQGDRPAEGAHAGDQGHESATGGGRPTPEAKMRWDVR